MTKLRIQNGKSPRNCIEKVFNDSPNQAIF